MRKIISVASFFSNRTTILADGMQRNPSQVSESNIELASIRPRWSIWSDPIIRNHRSQPFTETILENNINSESTVSLQENQHNSRISELKK